MKLSVFQVEIDFSGHPTLITVGELRGDEVLPGSGIGKNGSGPGATFFLALNAFEVVGGS